ncbi:MAG: hypothetical protein WCJ03_05510 [Bacteroidales bacterium]
MEKEILEVASLFIGNGYGFGKYEDGFLFMKGPSDPYLLYLTQNRITILTNKDRTIVWEFTSFSPEALSGYFELNVLKKTTINWFETVNVLILTADFEMTKKNIIYFFYPAVQLNFVDEIVPNTIVIYDRTVPNEVIEKINMEVRTHGIIEKTEFWSKIKLITVSERMGYLAPKGCFDKTMASFEKQA